jgi:hypothetical protein
MTPQHEERLDHLAWCKRRALEYVDRGDLPQALNSLYSDLGKHPETKSHIGIELGVSLQINGHLSTAQEVREFIEGFN